MTRSRLKLKGSVRFAAAAIVLIMLAALLSSALYIAAEADHDCSGEDCRVCANIQQCVNVLHLIGGAAAGHLIAAAAVSVFVFSAAPAPEDRARPTPVSRRVRLND